MNGGSGVTADRCAVPLSRDGLRLSEGTGMKRLSCVGVLAVFLSPLVLAQETVEAPTWNAGDRWVFTQGTIAVVGADETSYTLNFSKDTSILENKAFEKIGFAKSTLNRIFALKDDKRETYTIALRRILNFPMRLGSEWNDTFTATTLIGPRKGQTNKYAETVKVLAWEDVQVKAGKFRAIKLEYFQDSLAYGSGKDFYWYAPEAKYFVKCQYDPYYRHGVSDWELVSFELKK